MNTPVLVDGNVVTKQHGVPSGSMFTNIIDTIISKLVLTYLHRKSDCKGDSITYGDDAHSRNCTCSYSTIETLAKESFGMTIKIEKVNEHNCLTYCKAECHMGQPFHSGLWFSNILNCVPQKIRTQVAYCLRYMQPTRFQLKQLSKLFPAKSTQLTKASWYARKMITSGNPDLFDEMLHRGPVCSNL